MAKRDEPTPEPGALDLGYLALFVGLRVNELVLEAVQEDGHEGLRHAHGYVFQHLIGGPRTISELGGLLGVSQQAASKSVAELVALGYVESATAADARVRRVELSAKGRAAIARTRAIRAQLEARFEKRHGPALAQARVLLAELLEELGGAEAVRTRKIRAPR